MVEGRKTQFGEGLSVYFTVAPGLNGDRKDTSNAAIGAINHVIYPLLKDRILNEEVRIL